jgi:hypothetical protein
VKAQVQRDGIHLSSESVPEDIYLEYMLDLEKVGDTALAIRTPAGLLVTRPPDPELILKQGQLLVDALIRIDRLVQDPEAQPSALRTFIPPEKVIERVRQIVADTHRDLKRLDSGATPVGPTPEPPTAAELRDVLAPAAAAPAATAAEGEGTTESAT